MSRSPVAVRDAEQRDASALLRVWSQLHRRPSTDRLPRPPLSEVRSMLARVEADPEQRIVLAELEGEVVGAAYLTRIPTSPFALDSAVHMSHLQVVQHARRHGAGKALVESAVLWAEEKGACTVMAAATAHDREANRYLARLGFASLVVTRAASVSALRAGMLPVEPPACARSDVRNARTVGQVLAQRRSLRRAKTQAL